MTSDAARALEFMGASEVVTFPDLEKRPEGLETKQLMKKFYSQISEQEFTRLGKMYAMDFKVLGYRKPIYSEVIEIDDL